MYLLRKKFGTLRTRVKKIFTLAKMRHLSSFCILQIHYLHPFHQNGHNSIAKMKSYILLQKKENNRVKNWKKIEREREREKKTYSLNRA